MAMNFYYRKSTNQKIYNIGLRETLFSVQINTKKSENKEKIREKSLSNKEEKLARMQVVQMFGDVNVVLFMPCLH